MALIAHYPLNGDAKDYSGYGIVATHSVPVTYSDEGKIGRCLDGGAITLPAGVMNKFRQSISFWYFNKMTAPATTTHSQFMGNSSRDYALFAYPNNNDLHWDFRNETNSSIFSGSRSNLLPNKKWTHVTVVNDEFHFKIYINGVLEVQRVVSTWDNNVGNKSFPLIHNTPQAMFNDVRIYDHALSDKEVKEITKAKVLHYKFDEHEEPTENLAGGVTSFYSPYHTLEKSGNNFKMVVTSSVNYLTLGNGTNYTGQTVSVSGYLFKNGLPHVLPLQRINTYHSKNASKWLFNSVTGYFEITQEWTSTASNRWLFHTPTDAATGDVLEIKNMQFELKATPTGYTEGVRGGGSIVKDSSGFGNDGTVAVTTAPSWSEDSPVGRGSMEFSGAKFIDANHKIPLMDDFTVSFWVNSSSTSTATLGCSRTVLGKGFSIFFSVNGDIRWDTGDQQWSTGHAVKLNQWVHYTLVRRGNAKELYENAVLVKSTTYAGSMTNLGNSYSIGMSQIGGSGYGNPLNGAISDYRICATALTTEDILELYQTRASVDNEGNLFVQEIDEISDTSKEVDSRGIARFKEFNEVGGDNKMSIKNDGVVYVNEIMEA